MTVGDLPKWEANLDNPIVGDRTLIAQMETRTPLTNGDTSELWIWLAWIATGREASVIVAPDAGYRSDVKRYPDQG
jgi:hypothetical protein